MGDVVELGCVTRLPLPCDKVLDNAPRDMTEVLIIGFDSDGDFYFSASEPGTPENLYLLERARHELMKMEDKIYDEGLPGPPPRGA